MDKQAPRSTSYKTKKYYKRKRTSTKALVYKAVQTEFRKNAEKKYYTEKLSFSTNLAGNINTLAEPAQGTQSDEIIGNKITVTSVEVGITLFSPGLATTAPYNQTRITLITWKGQTTPTFIDLYEDTAIDFQMLSPFNTLTKKLRKVHYDMVFDQYYVNANGFAENPLKTIKFVVNMTNKKGRINEIWADAVGYTNQLYLFISSNNNGLANTQWSANVMTKVNYLDS